MRLFASNIKELQQERIGAPSWGWTGEGGTLLPITQPQPHEGGWGWGGGWSRDGGAFCSDHFFDFFIVRYTC